MELEEAELVLDAKASLGEGPSWDDKKGLLYWVDIIGEKIHVFDPVKEKDRTIQMGQFVTAVVPGGTDELILAMHHGLYRLNLEKEELSFIADPESQYPDNRFNDGKCDASGRFWAGTMATDESANKGAFYCLEKDYTVRKIFDGVTISNGMAWDESNKTMYYIDTPTQKVVAFDFDLASGSVENKRTALVFPDGKGYPDGMTIDEEGMLWIAHWGGSMISRWHPNTGECLDSVSVPASQVTSCVFGGKRLDELYITTARNGLTSEELASQPSAGGLFKVKPGVRGTRTHRFG